MCTVTHQLVTLAVEMSLHTPRVNPGYYKCRVRILKEKGWCSGTHLITSDNRAPDRSMQLPLGQSIGKDR